MRVKLYPILAGLVVLSMVLSACTSAATPTATVKPPDKPAATTAAQPTAVAPATATTAPKPTTAPATATTAPQATATTAAKPTAPPATATTAPAAKQRLRILANSQGKRGMGSFPEVCGLFDGWSVGRTVFYPLVNIGDDNLTLTPGVAVSWEASSDATVWTFKLDPKAKWSDGTPVTAQQIKRAFEFRYLPQQQCPWGATRFLGEEVKGAAEAWKAGKDDIPGIKTPDAQTLVFELVASKWFFAHQFASGYMIVFKPEPVYANPDPASYYKTMIGAGPFMYKEVDINKGSALMVRNPNWWREAPKLDELEIVPVVTDQQARLVGYKNNEWDMMNFGAAGALWSQVKGTPIEKDIKYTPGGMNVSDFAFREDLAPFDDVNVRKAFVHAIDYDAVVKSLLSEGPYLPNYSMFPPGNPFSQEKRPWKFDAALAKKELSESKYKSADKLPIIYLAIDDRVPMLTRLAQVYQQMWSQNLGVKVNIVQYTVPDPESFKKWQIFRAGEGFEGLDIADQLSKLYLSTSAHFCNKETWERGGQICEAVSPHAVEQRAQWKKTDDLIMAMQKLKPGDPEYGKMYNQIEDAFNEGYHIVPGYVSGGMWVMKPWVTNAKMGLGYNSVNHIEDTVTIAPH